MKMSGDIFQPLESFDDLDVSKWNPLLCYLCNEKYDDPCILGCYHSFCCRCVRGRAKDGKITCPLCGSETTIKEGMGAPPADQLMKFLVESSIEEKEKCANCDNETEQMFFCNTCSQPLCSTCRDDTHKAKMFARHEIVVLSKRTKEIHRECSVHHEPYILFSTEKKTMVCINCFRDMKIESRSYCVDLETAYNQGCKKLDHSLQAIRELQHSVRDALLLLRALIEEIKQNSDVEKKAIIDLYDSMQNKIAEKKTELLHEVDSQYDGKETLFKAQLFTLSTLLPTLHMHLVTSAAFSSSANKYEFLDLVYILMERLKSIIHLQHPLHPPHGSQIYTDYKSQFASCLEPLLFPHRNTSTLPTIATTSPLTLVTNTQARLDQTASTSAPGQLTLAPGGVALSFNGNGRRFLNRSMSIVKSSDIKSTFTDHCTDFDCCHKEITSAVDKLKNNVQELQRDLTLRRCLARKSTVSDLLNSISKMEDNIDLHYTNVEQKKPLLEKHWEESLQRIATEQEIYQAQLHDVLRLKQETGYLKTIVNKLSSFVKSIAAVTERIAPKLSLCDKECEHESTMHALFEQINTMQPDSQQRVDAIRTAQEERETTMTANKTNLMDEELIKTKGLLKAPSARVLTRKDSTKRHSREITDPGAGQNDDGSKSPECLSRKGSFKRKSVEITENCNLGADTSAKCCDGSKSPECLSRTDSFKRKSVEIAENCNLGTDTSAKCCDGSKSPESLSRKESFKRKSVEITENCNLGIIDTNTKSCDDKDSLESVSSQCANDASKNDSDNNLGGGDASVPDSIKHREASLLEQDCVKQGEASLPLKEQGAASQSSDTKPKIDTKESDVKENIEKFTQKSVENAPGNNKKEMSKTDIKSEIDVSEMDVKENIEKFNQKAESECCNKKDNKSKCTDKSPKQASTKVLKEVEGVAAVTNVVKDTCKSKKQGKEGKQDENRTKSDKKSDS